MKLAQLSEYLVSTVATDGLVISSSSAEYAPMHFQLFMGYLFHRHVWALILFSV